MGYRIEAVQPAVVDAVRRYGAFQVNGVLFRLLEGRAISDPVPEAAVGLFDVPGYLLVREEPPYERVSELGQEAMRLELDQALREGTLPPEALTGGGEEGSLDDQGPAPRPCPGAGPRGERPHDQGRAPRPAQGVMDRPPA